MTVSSFPNQGIRKFEPFHAPINIKTKSQINKIFPLQSVKSPSSIPGIAFLSQLQVIFPVMEILSKFPDQNP